jgi:hypothetical protein
MQEKMTISSKNASTSVKQMLSKSSGHVSASFQGLFSASLLGRRGSTKKFNFNGDDSQSSQCSNSTHDTVSLAMDDADNQSPDEDDYDEFAYPQETQFVHDTDLKLAGIKWKSTNSSEKYAQLNFVPQDTVVLVRRAPDRRKSSTRRIQYASASLVNDGQGPKQRSLPTRQCSFSRSSRTLGMDRSSHASASRPTTTRHSRHLSA